MTRPNLHLDVSQVQLPISYYSQGSSSNDHDTPQCTLATPCRRPPSSSQLVRRATESWDSRPPAERIHENVDVFFPDLTALESESSTVPTQNPSSTFKWVRGELIERGTYGRVYVALNATTGELFAVKQVEIPNSDANHGDTRQASMLEAVKREGEILKDLDHLNIVQYLGFEQTPRFLSIFLEYVPGGSVASCLRRHGNFEDQITQSFTGQILDGLKYLHDNCTIHRNIKADNILVNPSGTCKISDFGISERFANTNENGQGIRTFLQDAAFRMAPEIVQAARNPEQRLCNEKVDIWSLGCVVQEMWTGLRPWHGIDAIAVIIQLITGHCAPPVPQDVVLSAYADDFRQKCFTLNPEERPSASELREHRYLSLSSDWKFAGFK